ncbi:MAG: YheT family hydrolase [bacterium]
MSQLDGFMPFQRHPLLPGGHLQTVVGYYLPGPKEIKPDRVHQVPVSEGDRVAVCENASNWESAPKGAALFMHGLGGHEESPYMMRMAKLFSERGWLTFRMNHRGCGAGAGLARNLYHSGRSDDVSAVLNYLAELHPRLPLVAVGFSLSGNALLKLLGEQMHPYPDELSGAMAVTPPIDLSLCSVALCKIRNRIYDHRFVRLLKEAIKERQAHFPDFPVYRFPWNTTVRMFDEFYTAPLNHFESAEDYYTRCSAKQFLQNITVPTILLASDDDPFVPVKSFKGLPVNSHLQVHLTRSGGHMGFVSAHKTPLGDHRWLDYAVWFCSEKLLEARSSVTASNPP